MTAKCRYPLLWKWYCVNSMHLSVCYSRPAHALLASVSCQAWIGMGKHSQQPLGLILLAGHHAAN